MNSLYDIIQESPMIVLLITFLLSMSLWEIVKSLRGDYDDLESKDD